MPEFLAAKCIGYLWLSTINSVRGFSKVVDKFCKISLLILVKSLTNEFQNLCKRYLLNMLWQFTTHKLTSNAQYDIDCSNFLNVSIFGAKFKLLFIWHFKSSKAHKTYSVFQHKYNFFVDYIYSYKA